MLLRSFVFLLMLLSSCGAPSASEVPIPSVTSQLAATEPAPSVEPRTAMPSAKETLWPLPTGPSRPPLPPLPEPTPSAPDLALPPLWLVINNQAVLATRGGFSYTRDLGGGQIDVVTADTGSPQDFLGPAHVARQRNGEALIVVGSSAIATVRAAIFPVASEAGGEPIFRDQLRALGEQLLHDARIFSLPPLQSRGEHILAVTIMFSDAAHRHDYASYYWRLIVE